MSRLFILAAIETSTEKAVCLSIDTEGEKPMKLLSTLRDGEGTIGAGKAAKHYRFVTLIKNGRAEINQSFATPAEREATEAHLAAVSEAAAVRERALSAKPNPLAEALAAVDAAKAEAAEAKADAEAARAEAAEIQAEFDKLSAAGKSSSTPS